MTARSKWTAEHIRQLELIYRQQAKRGRKKLWVRISDRINATVRPAKRQAIEYKWKNLNTGKSRKQTRLCKDEELIGLIFDLVPAEGYHGLVHHQSFLGVTEANIKNIFYSNVRSMAKFLHRMDEIEESRQEILKMLGDRRFLSLVSTQNLSLKCLRSLILQSKCQINMGRPNLTAPYVAEYYARIRSAYQNRVPELEKGGTTNTQDDISSSSAKSQKLQPCKQEWETRQMKPKSMVFIEESFRCPELCSGGELFGEMDWNGSDFIC